MDTLGIFKPGISLSKRIFLDKEKLEQELAEQIVSTLELDLKKHGAAKLLLSGGSTPVKLYALLSQFDINWAQVTIGLVDERFVSPNDSHSNERMIKKTLLQGKASKAKFVGLVYDTDNLAKNLEIALAHNKPFLEGISCVLLGMGSDGHTASLFPNDEASLHSLVEEKNAQPILVTNAPSAPQVRISFTKQQLLQTSRLFLYFNGEEKMKVFSKAKMDNNPDSTPISSFIHQNEKLLEVFCTS